MADRSAAIKAQVTGFLNPIFVERDPRTGEVLFNGLGPRDYAMVREGYACARCLATFAQYTITCPACGLVRDWEADLEAPPALWLQHLAERQQEEPTRREPLSIERALAAKMRDPNLERIPLKGMRKSGKRARKS